METGNQPTRILKQSIIEKPRIIERFLIQINKRTYLENEEQVSVVLQPDSDYINLLLDPKSIPDIASAPEYNMIIESIEKRPNNILAVIISARHNANRDFVSYALITMCQRFGSDYDLFATFVFEP